jgi:hypothetical protein
VDRVIPYSANSFAFPLYVQQVFFAYEVDKPSWKVVLRKEPSGTRVASRADDRPEMQCFALGRDEELPGLTPELLQEDCDTSRPIMQNSRILSRDKVNRELLTTEEDTDFDDLEGADNDGAEGEDNELYD